MITDRARTGIPRARHYRPLLSRGTGLCGTPGTDPSAGAGVCRHPRDRKKAPKVKTHCELAGLLAMPALLLLPAAGAARHPQAAER